MRQDVYLAPALGGFEATRRDSIRVTARFFRPQRPPDRASPLAENWLGQTCRIVPHRLRWLAWALQLAVALAGGWIWFGNAGAALLGLWVCLWRPPKELLVEIPLQVRWVRLSAYAVTCRGGPVWRRRRTLRIYRDEVPPEAFAQLRRQLKDACVR